MAVRIEGTGDSSPSRPSRPPRPSSGGSNAVTQLAEQLSSGAPSTTTRPSLPQFEQTNVTKLTPMPAPSPVQVERPMIASMPRAGLAAAADPESMMIPSAESELPEERKKDAVPRKERKRRSSYQMTWEDYQALTRPQQAAVDFNTLMVQAREKDLNTDYKATPLERDTYTSAVQEMFGKDGGSEVFAPETMAALQQLEYKPEMGEVGDDLDDFLKLKVSFSAKDLRTFGKDDPSRLLDTLGVMTDQTVVQDRLVAGASKLKETMARSDQLIQDFASSAANLRNEDTPFLGGTPNEVKRELGFGETETDKYFRTAFEALADRQYDADLGALRSSIEGDLKSQGLLDSFYSYANIRSQRATDYELDLGATEDVKYRSPEEFRKILGLDKEG